MKEFNLAQRMYLSLGVAPVLLLKHLVGKTKSFTKKGPGRVHQQGKKKG